MSIGSRGNYDSPNTHHCDGCECPEEPDVPTVEQARELLESTIPAMLEEMRQRFGPYRVLFPWICGVGPMVFEYPYGENPEMRMGLRLLLISYSGPAELRMEWDVFGYSIHHTTGHGWKIMPRSNREKLKQAEIVNELTHAPAMREATALLQVWLQDMRRHMSSNITTLTRARLAPDTPAGKTSDAQEIADKLVQAVRAYEAQKELISDYDALVREAIEGYNDSRAQMKSPKMQARRESIESGLEDLKRYRSDTYLHI